MSRSDLILLIPLITGHNYLRHFSNKLKPLANTNCRLCSETLENFIHLLMNAPGYDNSKMTASMATTFIPETWTGIQ